MSVLKGSLQLLLDTDVALKSSRTDNRNYHGTVIGKAINGIGKGE